MKNKSVNKNKNVFVFLILIVSVKYLYKEYFNKLNIVRTKFVSYSEFWLDSICYFTMRILDPYQNNMDPHPCRRGCYSCRSHHRGNWTWCWMNVWSQISERQGCIKFLIPPPGGWGSISRLLGKNIKLLREERDFVTVGKNITWKKGKQYNLPYNIKAPGKNIKCMGKSGRGRQFWGRKSRFKQLGVGKNIVLWNYIHPCWKLKLFYL